MAELSGLLYLLVLMPNTALPIVGTVLAGELLFQMEGLIDKIPVLDFELESTRCQLVGLYYLSVGGRLR